MIDSLFSKKQTKQFDAIAKKKAQLKIKEKAAVDDFLSCNSKETILKVLDIVDENGHPNEKAQSCEIRKKYNDSRLEFDDIMTLETLYKSNYRYFRNKDECNE